MREYDLIWQRLFSMTNDTSALPGIERWIVVERGKQRRIVWFGRGYHALTLPPPQFPVGWRL